MPYRYADPRLKLNARRLRSGMTDAEQRLWAELRRKRLDGVQFYRQRPVGNYIVDFYAPAARLVVEVDGSQHMAAASEAYDADRSAALARLGLRVLRFDNRQVLMETRAVLEEILKAIRTIPPAPL